MDNALTWTQFATVTGLLALVAGAGAYCFKQWQEALFGRLYDRLDAIEAKMVTKDELRAELAEMELRLKAEAPAPPTGKT